MSTNYLQKSVWSHALTNIMQACEIILEKSHLSMDNCEV